MNINKLFFLFIFLATNAFAEAYSISDLEFLEKQKNYEEFILHANDVRPSKRSEHWIEMVHNMATGFVDFNFSRKSFTESSFLVIEKLANWPALRQDEFFQVKRTSFAKKFLKKCYETLTIKKCNQYILSFWNSSTKDPEAGFYLGKIIKEFGKKNPWPFYKAATLSSYSEFYCKRAPVQEALISQMIIDFKGLDPKKSNLSRYFNKSCWNKLLAPLKEMALDSNTSNLSSKDFSFRLLLLQNALTRSEKDLYYTLYLLHGPVVGYSFNEAWNTIRELGQNYKRREPIFNYLKSLDPLPGRVFNLSHKEKSQTLFSFLYKNFPEYVAYYGNTCVNYMQGKGHFPYGNPTPHCQNFFARSEQKKWVTQDLKQKYSSLKKH